MDQDRQISVEDPIRNECYRRVREHMKITLKAYYELHPDRLFDERGTEAVKVSLDGLREVFKILDEYTIEAKEKS